MTRLAATGTLAVVALAWSCAPASRAEDTDKGVNEIIAKAIEARGGQANLDKYKAETASFKGVLSINGMEVTISGTSKSQSPDKIHLNFSINFGGQEVAIAQIVNGNKGWQGANGSYAPLDNDALAQAREEFHASELTDLRGVNDKGVTKKSLGESKIDGKTAIGVKFSSPGFHDVSVYFDKQTGLVLKSESRGKDPMAGGEYKGETFYSDYKKVGKLTFAHKVKVLRDGKPYMAIELSSITSTEKLDDKEFSKPESGK